MVLTRVFAVLASRNGASVLPRTLEALDAQTLQPAASVGVDAASTDSTAEVLTGRVGTVVKLRSRAAYGAAIALGVAELPEASEGDWLWLLAHDAEPAPDALSQLVATADANRRVGIVGPKVMRAGDARTINEFGETMTPFGNAVRLAAGELDQGQYDSRSDVLGVAETGLLIRRDVFEQLGGFDPALTTADAGLDLGVRARLAGHQVSLQPKASVRRNGGAELFAAKSVSDAALTTIRRRAQLHRRFVYANPLVLVLHWLLALPLAGIRSVGHLFAKRPASVVSEFSAALVAMFSFGHVVRGRRRIRRARSAQFGDIAAGGKALPWSELRPLRIDWRTLRARRRLVGDDVVENTSVADERIGFVASGTLWVTAFALLAGVVLQLSVITSSQITGGALLPLGSFTEMWHGALYGDRDGLGSVVGAADPFAILAALLGSLTFWQPMIAIVITLVAAPALSTVSAWMLARRVTRVAWAPPVAAAIWAFAPTLLISVYDGRLGAVLAHVLLPVVAYGVLRAGTLWRAAALGALALAVTAAGAPSLMPALVIGIVVAALWFAIRVRFGGVARVLAMLVPTLALFVPLVWSQRERLLTLLADPGIPLGYPAPDALELATGYPDAALGTLGPLIEQVQLAGTVWPMWGTIVLVAPLILATFAAPFLRALPGLASVALALAGFATAVAATRISVAGHGAEVVALWTGPGLSLALLGLLIGACVTIGVLDFRSGPLGSLLTVFAALTGLAVEIGRASCRERV